VGRDDAVDWITIRESKRVAAMQRLRSSAACSWLHGPGREAVIGSAVDLPSAMTAVDGEAVVQTVRPAVPIDPK
jgi:hypothetical protein